MLDVEGEKDRGRPCLSEKGALGEVIGAELKNATVKWVDRKQYGDFVYGLNKSMLE